MKIKKKKYFYERYLPYNLKQRENKIEYLKSLELGTLKYFIYRCKIYLKQMIYLHFSKFVIILVTIYAVAFASGLGILIFTIILIIIMFEQRKRWSVAWIPLLFFSISSILIQYLLQFEFLKDKQKDILVWVGF